MAKFTGSTNQNTLKTTTPAAAMSIFTKMRLSNNVMKPKPTNTAMLLSRQEDQSPGANQPISNIKLTITNQRSHQDHSGLIPLQRRHNSTPSLSKHQHDRDKSRHHSKQHRRSTGKTLDYHPRKKKMGPPPAQYQLQLYYQRHRASAECRRQRKLQPNRPAHSSRPCEASYYRNRYLRTVLQLQQQQKQHDGEGSNQAATAVAFPTTKGISTTPTASVNSMNAEMKDWQKLLPPPPNYPPPPLPQDQTPRQPQRKQSPRQEQQPPRQQHQQTLAMVATAATAASHHTIDGMQSNRLPLIEEEDPLDVLLLRTEDSDDDSSLDDDDDSSTTSCHRRGQSFYYGSPVVLWSHTLPEFGPAYSGSPLHCC